MVTWFGSKEYIVAAYNHDISTITNDHAIRCHNPSFDRVVAGTNRRNDRQQQAAQEKKSMQHHHNRDR
jgi:hypothetical protein